MDFLKGFHGEFAWLIWGLFGLGVIWFFTGGTESPSAHEGAYIKPLAPLDSGRVYGKYYAGGDSDTPETLNLSQTPGNLLRKAENLISGFFDESKKAEETKPTIVIVKTLKNIFFDGIGKAKESDPNKEYLVVEADNSIKNSVLLSDLILRSSSQNTAILIPKAVKIAVLGTTMEKENVYLSANNRAYITTGRSPIGNSFRVNMCSGYLDQFQDYVPDLEKNCPDPVDELKKYGPYSDSVCLDLVEKIPRCRIYQGSLPRTLSESCVNFLAEKLNYNACVANHKTDENFLKKEWRLFLNQSTELWQNKNEIIRLMNSAGETLDSINY
jgi:hypothetical protein